MTWLPADAPEPRRVMSVGDALLWQELFVAAVARAFAPGPSLLDGGDAGLVEGLGRPLATARCEAVLAEVFGGEDAVLVRGAGTGAVRLSLFAAVPPSGRVLVHRPATYLTSRLTLDAMGVALCPSDFNDPGDVERAIAERRPDAVLVQHMPPRVDDRYDVGRLSETVRALAEDTPIVVDDNYAPLKVPALGVVLGADLSAFSLFKLGGPEGVGCVLGRRDLVDRIRPFMNSGGSVVQGHESLAVIHALARAAPVIAHQSAVTREIAARLATGEVLGVRRALATHSPETVVLVELEDPLADAVRDAAGRLGAVTRPVGMESYHEVVPAFLRPSKSLTTDLPGIEDYVVRISAMRAGADLVVEILRAALERARRTS